MPFNLIEEHWIPLRRASGAVEWRPPWAVTDAEPGDDDPFVAVAATRPDLSGALVQFLIGLAQTCAPPADDREWRRWWQTPPKPEELRQRFMAAAHAFNLDGPGPRFLQTPLSGNPKRWPISQMLMDQPGKKTLEENKALFIKPAGFALCPACLAASLFCLQTNAPEGGQGKSVSLRGGGPLTTLVLGNTLWHTIWLAVISRDSFWSKRAPSDLRSPDLFRWLGPPLSDDNFEKRTPLQSDPAYAYWAMPRRVWVDFDAAKAEASCSLCRRETSPLVQDFGDRPKGIKHEGGWQHPLSPHYYKDGQLNSVKGDTNNVSYKNWLGLVVADQERNKFPAQVVQSFFQHRLRVYTELLSSVSRRSGGRPQLWAFGYDMDQNKARGWVESLMPLVVAEEGQEADFALAVGGLVKTAEQAVFSLASALKKAWFPEGASVKVNQGDLGRVSQSLWDTTEADFYAALDRLKALLEQGHAWESGDPPDAEMTAFKESWLKTLSRAAQTVFHEYSQEKQIGRGVDPRRIAQAGSALEFFVSTRAKKLRGVMSLPSLAEQPPQDQKGSTEGENE